MPFRVILLIVLSVPIIVGYLWMFISTFSIRTHGLMPVDSNGNFGGLTLANWAFLKDPVLWQALLNTFVLAAALTFFTVLISSMAGYALSRIQFPYRRQLLSLTLVLHAFPSVTLLIAIYFVLKGLSSSPILGPWIGYNTMGGVILVSVAMQLPLGIWLMKGFFDGLSWDVERSALLDGCTRLGVFWRIALPMAGPGVAALSIFSFITGWGSFLIPYTFMMDQGSATLATYLMQSMTDTAPAAYGTLAAIGLFQTIPILGFFIFTQKHLMNIYTGGSKGAG
ncbi:MAG: ABC transporter permease [Elusimicrobia bacterium]|nr:MAG: ABC transporter permease [Elusimicrobiota bacterium]